ncbi:hypothetical protein HRI_003071400 [Hibiscus trionum]|uniref:Uncharacterized protein n=1 Tax=Hibiscus trionum TaxID=183268 RepID=A0A9W7IEW7_HIBTR|nr:hypothetical protein HRI_003071400 [Hibiscus trionum]
MAVLASCWLIIESIIIPHGFFLRWFYLSFYIHPFFLFAFQILLCLKWLKRFILTLFIYPYRIFTFLVFCVYRFCRYCIFFIFSFIRVKEDDSNVEAADNFSQNQLIRFSVSSSIPSVEFKAELVEPQRGLFIDVNGCEDFSFRLQQDLRADECSSFFCSSSPSINGSYLDEYSPLFSSSNSPLMKECPLPARGSGSRVSVREIIATAKDEDESEVFYQKYSERMRWFDVLNHDRTQGIGAILNMEMGSPSSLEKIKLKDLTIPYISWSNHDKKKLLKSLQSDFELVYVAQSCLTWEALHHQYRKVKFLCFTNCLFADNLAKDFETFQVLIERFLDEERYLYKGKRAWNYVQARHASKTLLQVPKVTGYLEEEKEGETVDAKDMLKAIEKCIKAFGKFITKERNKSWWKFNTSLGTYPPMENPRDLQLLADLTTTLAKKEVWLKDLQGKQKCWFNKVVKPMEESQKEAMLFTIIEMKLISRVLQMSIVSSSQLKWCQQKLNNIQFQRGRLFRTATGPLFPSS